MLISKNKFTLLKSIAMILTVIMIACICFTACGNKDAQEAKTLAEQAKQIAENAQKTLDEELQKKVNTDDVAKMIENALKTFSESNDGQAMVNNVLNSDAGKQMISDAVATALNSKVEGLQTAEQVKALIIGALNGTDSSMVEAVQAAMSKYVTAESANQLVSEAMDDYLNGLGANTASLEAFKGVVAGMVNESIGDSVATYLASDEAKAVINASISDLNKAGLADAAEATAKIVVMDKKVADNHWTAADKAAINAAYAEYINPMFENVEEETDVVKILYILHTIDSMTLKANIAACEEVVNSCESIEMAAAKIDEKILALGKDVNGDIDDELVASSAIATADANGKFGYVIVVDEEGNYVYYTVGNFAKLGADNGDKTVYAGFDLIYANYGKGENYFSTVTADESSAVEVLYVIAPVFEDEAAIKEIEDEIQAMVDKFGPDYPWFTMVSPEVPDDMRTEENEYQPAKYVYNPECGIVCYDFLSAYKDMIATVKTNGKAVIDAVNAFMKKAGDAENEYKYVTDASVKDWAEYKAVLDAYQAYNNSRFGNVVDGVEEAYAKVGAGKIDDLIAKAEAAALQARKEKWMADYNAHLEALEKAYNEIDVPAMIPVILNFAAIYESPIYQVATMTGESVELYNWAKSFTDNLDNLKHGDVTVVSAINSDKEFNAAIVSLNEQFATFEEKLQNVIAGDGIVAKNLYEIDAKWWYETVQQREVANIKNVLVVNNFAAWNCEDKTIENDIYDIAVKYIDEYCKQITEYDIESAKATQEFPYSTAVDTFLDLAANVEAEVVALEKYYDNNYSVMAGEETVPANVDPKNYYSYIAKTVDALKAVYETLGLEYNPADAKDEYEYGPYRIIFDADYASLVASIEDVKPGKSYVAVLRAIDEKLVAAKRALQIDVYEMKIDRFAVRAEQSVNTIFNDYYTKGDHADAFHAYWEDLLKIVSNYQLNIIPGETFAKYSNNGLVSDEDAYNAALEAIKTDVDQAMRDLAKKVYMLKLIDTMIALQADVDAYQVKAVEGTTDLFKLFDAIKEQIDAIVDGDAILDDSDVEVGATTSAYLDEIKALYDAKLVELDTAVEAYKTLIDAAVKYTKDIVAEKDAAIADAQKLYNATVEKYTELDYQKRLVNDFNKVKRNIGDVVIVRPFHVEVENDQEVKVYDVLTLENVTAAYTTASDAVKGYLKNYTDELNAYKALMDQYKQRLADLENAKESLIAKIESYLELFDPDSVDGTGCYVDFDAESCWTVQQNVFEKNSPIYFGMLDAIEAIKEVQLVMRKSDELIAAEQAAAGEDAVINPYYTPDEAYAYAVKKATFNRDRVTVSEEGGALWAVLRDCIVDETGRSSFLYFLNQSIGKLN